MNKLVALLLAFCAWTAMPSRAQTGAISDSGVDAPPRIYLAGFSVLMPANLDWLPVQKQAFEISLARENRAQNQGFAANAFLLAVPVKDLDDAGFLGFIKKARLESTDRSRFLIVANEEGLADDRAERCVKYHSTLEDHSAAKSGNGPIFVIETFGYSCVHPQDSNIGLDFNFSTRRFKSDARPDFDDEASSFLHDVHFETMKPAELSAMLYNSGMVMRRRGEFADAETMLSRALAFQEKLPVNDEEAVGRRMAELAAAYIAQGKLEQGVPLVKRLMPLSDSFSTNERRFLVKLFAAYAEEMEKANFPDAVEVEAKARALKERD